MEIQITTLSENTANYGFLAEWGLSILIEVDETKILLDTGLSFSAVHNAQLLGIDLSTIDRIMISHGHADHTGGLREVLRRTGEIVVIAHPDMWAFKYARRDQEEEQYVGIRFCREEMESLGARFDLGRQPVHITDRVMTTGEIPMTSGYEEIDKNLFVKEGGMLQPDNLDDDLALVIDRSGSMAGGKLPRVKQAALALLGQLGEGDRVTLISYAGAVTRHVIRQPVDDRGRSLLRREILDIK